MDEGFSGLTSETDVFLSTQGCISEETARYRATIPFGVSLLEVALEVLRGEADMLFGSGLLPVQYFNFGAGPGSQKILVDASSNNPLHAGTWYVDIMGLSGVSAECDPNSSPDWRLRVQRAQSLNGINLLNVACEEAACQVPACNTPSVCPSNAFTFDLPGDAVFLEVTLQSLQGDADLFLGISSQDVLFSSTNPGTGFDVIQVGSDEALRPLRGQTLTLTLESWGQATQEYSLIASYLPGFVAAPSSASSP